MILNYLFQVKFLDSNNANFEKFDRNITKIELDIQNDKLDVYFKWNTTDKFVDELLETNRNINLYIKTALIDLYYKNGKVHTQFKISALTVEDIFPLKFSTSSMKQNKIGLRFKFRDCECNFDK